MRKDISQIVSFHLLIFQWEVVKCMPDWWYDFMVVIRFSACYEHANVFWELRTNQACGKGHGPPHCKLSNNKDCCCAADFCAAPRNSRAETTKFRKRLKTRGTWEPRGGIEAQFSKLAVSKIFHQYWCYAHQYWWMLKDDLWYEQASGNILLKNNVWLNIFKKWL